MRFLLYAVIALVLVVGVVLAIGAMLPVKHVATRERLFAAPPDRLYSAISRVSDYPTWKTGVRAVEELVFGHYKTMDSTLDDLQRYVTRS